MPRRKRQGKKQPEVEASSGTNSQDQETTAATA